MPTTSKEWAHITKTHYGHKISLGHLRLSKQDKLSVAGQLLQGVNFDSLLDKVRDNVGTKLQRIHLIVKKDLYNIERAFHLEDVRGTRVIILVLHYGSKKWQERKRRVPFFFINSRAKLFSVLKAGSTFSSLSIKTSKITACTCVHAPLQAHSH